MRDSTPPIIDPDNGISRWKNKFVGTRWTGENSEGSYGFSQGYQMIKQLEGPIDPPLTPNSKAVFASMVDWGSSKWEAEVSPPFFTWEVPASVYESAPSRLPKMRLTRKSRNGLQ
jgi:hypothetical protein